MGTEPLRVYQVVEIQVGEHTALARIRGLSKEEITVEPMGWSEADALLAEGASVRVFYAGVDALFCLDTSVTTVVNEPVRRVYLRRHDDDVARIQRRQHFRVDVRTSIRYGLPGSGGDDVAVEGYTRDVSAGGALLEVEDVRDPGTLLQLHIQMRDGARPLAVVGRVVRAGESKGWDAANLLGVEFVALTEDDRSRIARWLFELRADQADAEGPD